MGGGNSKTVNTQSTITSEITNNIAKNINSGCTSSTINSQTIRLNNLDYENCNMVNIGGEMTINSKASNNCQFENGVKGLIQASLQDSLKNKLDLEQGSSLFEVNNKNDINTITNITRNLVTNNKIDALSSCLNTEMAKQEYVLDGMKVTCFNGDMPSSVTVNPKLFLEQVYVGDCVAKNLFDETTTNDIQTLVDNQQKVKQKDVLQTAGEGLATMFKGLGEGIQSASLGLMAPMIIIGVVIVSLGSGTIVKSVMGSSSSDSGGPYAGSSGAYANPNQESDPASKFFYWYMLLMTIIMLSFVCVTSMYNNTSLTVEADIVNDEGVSSAKKIEVEKFRKDATGFYAGICVIGIIQFILGILTLTLKLTPTHRGIIGVSSLLLLVTQIVLFTYFSGCINNTAYT